MWLDISLVTSAPARGPIIRKQEGSAWLMALTQGLA